MARTKVQPGVDTTSVSGKDIKRQQSNKAAAGGGGEGGAPFAKAIVAEVINNPAGFEEHKEGYQEKFKSESAGEAHPRGTLLVKMLDEGNTKELTTCYPFFQSHIMLPAKVGEQVWVFSDGAQYSYWISRVSGSGLVEDVNYTHKDRELETPSKTNDDAKKKKEKASGETKNHIGRFNNGAGPQAKNAPKDQDSETFEADAKMTKHTAEAVPRYSPRPGDLVLQGSNNTLISLGTDRGWKKSDTDFSKSNSTDQAPETSGTIDIVVGRGMAEEEQTATDESTKGSDPSRAGLRLVKNDRGQVETDKASHMNDQEENPCEGDPDFEMDSSRVYISMNTKIDESFSLADELPVPFEGTFEDMEAAAIGMKSNEIRVVARGDGSIRIVKEKGEGETPASIIMQADGSIHISGEKIFLGKSGDDGGLATSDGPGNSEPYVRYSDLEAYLQSVHASFDTFCQTLSVHTTPGYGAPSPKILEAASTLKGELSSHKSKIPKFKSERIFGE